MFLFLFILRQTPVDTTIQSQLYKSIHSQSSWWRHSSYGLHQWSSVSLRAASDNMRQSHNETKSERFLFSLRVVTFVFLTRSKSGVGLTLKIAFNVCVGYFGRSRLWTPQKVGPCLVRQGVVFVNRWCRGVARGCRVRGKWHENG